MQTKKIGMITIGQSPRPDILNTFSKMWGNKADLIEMGALDGMSHTEVSMMEPEEGEDTLVIKMNDGIQHKVSKERLLPRIQTKIDEMKSEQTAAMVLCCTGPFQDFNSDTPVIIPQKIVDERIEEMVQPGDTIGILIPTAEQERNVYENLKHLNINIVCRTASPHLGMEGIEAQARLFKEENNEVKFIVMYCFGYTVSMKDIVEDITGKQVIVSNVSVAEVAGELL